MLKVDDYATAFQPLVRVLEGVPPGPVENEIWGRISPILTDCWSKLKGGAETSMAAYKLTRAEDLRWNPPFLSFVIERHGRTVLGSKRADLQEWTVNLTTGAAECTSGNRFRQLSPNAPRVDVKPIVDKVCRAVVKGFGSQPCHDKQIIKWLTADDISIKHGELVGGDCAQTISGRRRRFRTALIPRMEAIGWYCVSTGNTMKFRRSAER
jgi:hypothetical protein